jgi:TolB-like protein/AraC-like DNA-binding protein
MDNKTGQLDPIDSEFLRRIHGAIEANLADDQFGVSELASEMNMSRSNLLRKVRRVSDQPVNQLIREVRLKRAMELLRSSAMNVSEVSQQVGFSSPSYFIKCFREQFGFPPGETAKRSEAELNALLSLPVAEKSGRRISAYWLAAIILLVATLTISAAVYYGSGSLSRDGNAKSIAVLPFKNESNDSTNVYLINGLMESTLSNLQKIEGLRVISRTTSESFRDTHLSAPQLARELEVKYIVQGSGQKIDDRILLNIQLIDAESDSHVWANQYRSQVQDIFALQQEIADDIAEHIQVIITPEVRRKIEKTPSRDPVAYEYFLKGKELFYRAAREDLEAAIPWLRKAIERDPEFALAYASMSVVYYYLDLFLPVKEHGFEIANYSDRAMALDPNLAESRVARALTHTYRKEFDKALPEFEKALELDPTSGLVTHFLVEYFNIHVPNTKKYLQYSLLKVKQDLSTRDSVAAGYNYMHLANALMQNGFQEPALRFANKSLELDPANVITAYLRIYIRYGMNNDLEMTRKELIKVLAEDTTRFDLLQEVGKTCYYLGDYQQAYRYYRPFLDIRKALNLEIFRHQDLNIAFVLHEVGQERESRELLEAYRTYAENDKTMYRSMLLACYYAYIGDSKAALHYLDEFSREDNFQVWVLLLRTEPTMASLAEEPRFLQIMEDIRDKFRAQKEEVEDMLVEAGIL